MSKESIKEMIENFNSEPHPALAVFGDALPKAINNPEGIDPQYFYVYQLNNVL